MRKKPEILSVKKLASSRLFTLEEVHLHFNNGNQRYYERLRNNAINSVLIVPLLNQDTLLLVREYAVGIEDYHVAFPKGLVEPDEDISQAADRELKEEVGYGAKNIRLLKRVSTSPGYTTRSSHIVLAKELYPARLEGDEPETIEVISWPLKDISRLSQHPEFHETQSIAALLLLQEHLKS